MIEYSSLKTFISRLSNFISEYQKTDNDIFFHPVIHTSYYEGNTYNPSQKGIRVYFTLDAEYQHFTLTIRTPDSSLYEKFDKTVNNVSHNLSGYYQDIYPQEKNRVVFHFFINNAPLTRTVREEKTRELLAEQKIK